jgi:hypothetical protein
MHPRVILQLGRGRCASRLLVQVAERAYRVAAVTGCRCRHKSAVVHGHCPASRKAPPAQPLRLPQQTALAAPAI